MVLSKESYDWLIPQFACVILLKTGDNIVFEDFAWRQICLKNLIKKRQILMRAFLNPDEQEWTCPMLASHPNVLRLVTRSSPQTTWQA